MIDALFPGLDWSNPFAWLFVLMLCAFMVYSLWYIVYTSVQLWREFDQRWPSVLVVAFVLFVGSLVGYSLTAGGLT